jgi:RimJ/RimL family protein N-acetyltransferase
LNRDQIIVKPLTAQDAQAFKALRLNAISDSPAAIWPTYEEEARTTPEAIGERIRQSDTQIVFGAFDGSRLIGIVGLRRQPLVQVAHKAVLWGVLVDPQWRGSGVARMLLERAIAHARDTDVLQINLAVHTENPRAQRLYQSLGFEAYGVERRAVRVADRFYDEQHMTLRLDS